MGAEWDKLQDRLMRLVESKKQDFIGRVQDSYGDSPDTIFTACRFAYNIHGQGKMSDAEFDKICKECRAYFAERGDDANLLKLGDLMTRLDKARAEESDEW